MGKDRGAEDGVEVEWFVEVGVVSRVIIGWAVVGRVVVVVGLEFGGSGSEGGGVGRAVGFCGVCGFLRGERKGLWRAVSRRRRLGGWGRDMDALQGFGTEGW